MIGLLGKKVGMTQVFNKEGVHIGVTVLEVGPCSVVQVKTKESDGYQAVQLGFGVKKVSRTSKAAQGHFKKHKAKPLQFVREIRTDSIEGLEAGKEVHVNNFAIGDLVDITGTSIGRGFQGVVKRHRFKGGERAHGSMFGREPGSVGQSAYPSRVFKGVKLPGHMGAKRATTQNIVVEKVDVENHLITVRGSVPGPDNSYVIIREAIKHRRPRKWRQPGEELEVLKITESKQQVPAKKAGKTAAKKPAPKKKK
jgi:large subunit ribosomal protein L3